MAILSLLNVSYRYPNAENFVVKNVCCVFAPGVLYAIVGPSGSGKSTLLSLLAGLDTPTDGEILCDSTPLHKMDLDRYRREDISMIFQSFELFPLMTALENVCYPLELQGVTPKDATPKAAALLERVGIHGTQMKRFPSRLSGGEQQRVAIARSLASGAKTLLADEPTGNLDIANKKVIVEMLANLSHKEAYCTIVVTHDMEVANEADIVFYMADGALREGR